MDKCCRSLETIVIVAAAVIVLAALFLSSCAAPMKTSKVEDPLSVELSKTNDGLCTVRLPGGSARDITADCLSGRVEAHPNKDEGTNWTNIGLALIALFKIAF